MSWSVFVANVGGVLNTRLFELGGTTVTLKTMVVVLLVVVGTSVLSRLVQRGVHRAFRHRGVKEDGNVGAIARLIHYGLMLIGIGIALQTAGFNLNALFAAGAIFAVGLGFAMQNIAQNFVSGVILLIERAIKPGDVVEVEGRVVKVAQMGIRATIVQTRNGAALIVPNSVLVQSMVKNLTFKDSYYRVRAQVGVVYSADMRLVLETLEQVAGSIEWRVPDLEPVVLLLGFGDNSVNFDVSVWTDDPWETPKLLSALYQAIWWAFKEQSVTIAFPQLDLHLDPPVVESLKTLAA